MDLPINKKKESIIATIKKNLKKLSDKERAKILARFFKTAPGEYGEGDIFYGIKVPEIRKLAAQFSSKVRLSEICIFLRSKYHEERFLALIFLEKQYQKLEVLIVFVKYFKQFQS